MSNFFALTHNEKVLFVEESLSYLHNFKSKFIPKLKVYFKRKQKHFRTKEKVKKRGKAD